MAIYFIYANANGVSIEEFDPEDVEPEEIFRKKLDQYKDDDYYEVSAFVISTPPSHELAAREVFLREEEDGNDVPDDDPGFDPLSMMF